MNLELRLIPLFPERHLYYRSSEADLFSTNRILNKSFFNLLVKRNVALLGFQFLFQLSVTIIQSSPLLLVG